jgi:dipeptidyl aminopeptidase/acylaminoacyl peptidase
MIPGDLARLVTVSDPQMHPDGRRVAFVVSRMDPEKDRYLRLIWLWDGLGARPFTGGPADGRPRWSPDGSRLAFLRSTGDEGFPAQVAVMPADGGEAETITGFSLGCSEAEWSPDGSLLAVIGSEWIGEWAGLDEQERRRRPRRLSHPDYRFDDLGWRHDRCSNVYLVAFGRGVGPEPLSPGEFHDSGVVWRPDGSAVGFLSGRHDGRYLDGGVQPWEVATAGGSPVALTAVGRWAHISYRDDGVVHLVGQPDPWDYPSAAGLWRIEEGAPVQLAVGLDRSFATPSPSPVPAGPQWAAGRRCLSIVEDRGRMRVVEVDADGAVSDVLGGDRLVTGLTVRRDGSAFAFTATTPTDPGELWWWEGGAERTLTSLNAAFRQDAGLVAPEAFSAVNEGGEVDAWAYLPPGKEKVPLLLVIHGGPATQYGFGFFDEFQVYAGAGLGVVACNPRGSSGRGREFSRAPVGRWGEDRPPDLEDLLAVVDAALDRFPRLDRDRMGVMGGSYGGFMTARILTVDDRFRSAVPERGLYSFTSFAGTSDIGLRFPRHYLGDWQYSGWESLWSAGVLARAHLITTPCLLVHCEGDLRCPIEQAEQLFAVLAARGVEVEMLRFPGGSHELSRSGKPRYRLERFEAILEWHRRHLSPGDVTTWGSLGGPQ